MVDKVTNELSKLQQLKDEVTPEFLASATADALKEKYNAIKASAKIIIDAWESISPDDVPDNAAPT